MLSGLGFALRGYWMLQASPWRQHRLTRIVPHIVDSLLLGSALTLALLSHQYPFVEPWLTAKLFGLLVYIACGTMALKRGKSRRVRAWFLVASFFAYAFIIVVAITRSPWPIF